MCHAALYINFKDVPLHVVQQQGGLTWTSYNVCEIEVVSSESLSCQENSFLICFTALVEKMYYNIYVFSDTFSAQKDQKQVSIHFLSYMLLHTQWGLTFKMSSPLETLPSTKKRGNMLLLYAVK